MPLFDTMDDLNTFSEIEMNYEVDSEYKSFEILNQDMYTASDSESDDDDTLPLLPQDYDPPTKPN